MDTAHNIHPESSQLKPKQPQHVSDSVELQAQKLIEQTGTPELAKQAIEAAQQPDLPPVSKDELATRLGYTSFLELFEASTPVAARDGTTWYLTPGVQGNWLVWSDADFTLGPTFPSKSEAEAFLANTIGSD